jgi:hypothetical protein
MRHLYWSTCVALICIPCAFGCAPGEYDDTPSDDGGATGSGASGGAAGSSTAGGGPVVLTGVETPTPPCTVATPPAYSALATNAKLPDPFTLANGTSATTWQDWACRRAEILAQVAQYGLGPKPPKPSSVTGSLSGNTLTIDVSDGTSSMSFTATISKPRRRPASTRHGSASPDARATARARRRSLHVSRCPAARADGAYRQVPAERGHGHGRPPHRRRVHRRPGSLGGLGYTHAAVSG